MRKITYTELDTDLEISRTYSKIIFSMENKEEKSTVSLSIEEAKLLVKDLKFFIKTIEEATNSINKF